MTLVNENIFKNTLFGRFFFFSLLFLVAIFFAMLLAQISAVASEAGGRKPGLQIADNGLSAGYVTLEWSGVVGETYELQMNDGKGWQTVYAGPQTLSTFSGLADGVYQFRLRADQGDWRPPFRVEIRHHPLDRALVFFGIGLGVFLILVGVLWHGGGVARGEAASSPASSSVSSSVSSSGQSGGATHHQTRGKDL